MDLCRFVLGLIRIPKSRSDSEEVNIERSGGRITPRGEGGYIMSYQSHNVCLQIAWKVKDGERR
jgi:hypothetical protein